VQPLWQSLPALAVPLSSLPSLLGLLLDPHRPDRDFRATGVRARISSSGKSDAG